MTNPIRPSTRHYSLGHAQYPGRRERACEMCGQRFLISKQDERAHVWRCESCREKPETPVREFREGNVPLAIYRNCHDARMEAQRNRSQWLKTKN